MHIATAFDAAYFPAASASVDSILRHHAAGEVHLWLVVAHDVTAEHRAALSRQVSDRATLSFIDAPATVDLPMSTHVHRLHVSTATYLRLQIPELLPESVERVIYLDADTICLDGLAPLNGMALEGAVVAAVRDPYLSRLSDLEGIPGIGDWVGVDPQGPSLSPAVMLIDCHAWRSANITQTAMTYCADTSHACRYMDQDALNLALQGRWIRIGSKWGFSRTSRVESAWGGSLAGLHVLHYLGVEKPWQDDYPSGDRRELFQRHHRAAMQDQRDLDRPPAASVALPVRVR